MHFVLLGSDFDDDLPPRWKSIDDRSLVTLARGHEPEIEAL
jgi:hypothetical protein